MMIPIQRKKPESPYYHSIQCGNISFFFFKKENDTTESLFCIACSSLIAVRGIKQSLPTIKKGVQKICWWQIQWTQFRKIRCISGLTEPIHSPVNSWHASFTMAEKLQEVSLFCKQHVEQLPWHFLILTEHWDIFFYRMSKENILLLNRDN